MFDCTHMAVVQSAGTVLCVSSCSSTTVLQLLHIAAEQAHRSEARGLEHLIRSGLPWSLRYPVPNTKQGK
uniref:Uncharacterized protein n=1 Tax=Oryza sativa subsp. japonica TaxID=39947 RepID=Q6K3E3_ORYSJ|nr:hypothetical protein [Oryza sativa Japonica Group]BAD22397.1 hypothetical protein [Oryza sativa Japonica Group]